MIIPLSTLLGPPGSKCFLLRAMGSRNITIGDSLRLIIGSLRLIIGSQGFPEFDSKLIKYSPP